MRIDLRGKVALVTGAGGGIGRQIALQLAEAGSDVALLGRTEGSLRESQQLIEETGVASQVLAIDVTDVEAVKTIAPLVERGVGPVDILVNNAGGARFVARMDELEERGWDKAFALNVRAPFSVARHLSSQLARDGRGSIINIGSTVGLSAHPGLSHYSTAKSAVVILTRNMASEWGSHGIRVNAVLPGLIQTDAWESFDGDELEGLREQEPLLQRWGTAEDVANATVFLASDAASYVTGASLLVDGGATA